MKLAVMVQNELFLIKEKLASNKGEFAMDAVLGMALTLIIAAFIIIPNMKNLSSSIMGKLVDWWDNTVSTKIFTS